jgi:hypothetical protein
LSGSARYIDDAPARERATIIDAQLHGAAVIEVGYLDDARHRQCAMRGGQLVQIEDLAVCGILLVELFAVPRGHSGLFVIIIYRRIVPDAPDLIRGTDLVHRPPGTVMAAALAICACPLLRTASRHQERDRDRHQYADAVRGAHSHRAAAAGDCGNHPLAMLSAR